MNRHRNRMKIMKTKNKLLVITAAFAALSLSTSLNAAQPIRSSSLPTNRALLVSPRILEEFPELSRGSPTETETRAAAARWSKHLAEIRKNRAFAASPRTLEQYPELARTAPSVEESRAREERHMKHLAEVTRNRAFAASPRTLEEFPELARGWVARSERSTKAGVSKPAQSNK